MARFKPNQEVVCVADEWINIDTEQDDPYGPKKNDIVTVECYSERNSKFCCFVEYPDLDENGERYFFHEENFQPVISDAAIAELFQEQPEFV